MVRRLSRLWKNSLLTTQSTTDKSQEPAASRRPHGLPALSTRYRPAFGRGCLPSCRPAVAVSRRRDHKGIATALHKAPFLERRHRRAPTPSRGVPQGPMTKERRKPTPNAPVPPAIATRESRSSGRFIHPSRLQPITSGTIATRWRPKVPSPVIRPANDTATPNSVIAAAIPSRNAKALAEVRRGPQSLPAQQVAAAAG